MKENSTGIPFLISQKHIPSLDGLRALAITLVICSHIFFNFSNKYLSILQLGAFGVNIFFVISGFLITSLLLKEKALKNKVSFKNFYIRRALRILPLAYLFILVLIILNNIYGLKLGTKTFLRTAFFCEDFVSHPHFLPNGHFWSLSTEEQFYLLFPFILVRDARLLFKLSIFLFAFVPIVIYTYYHIKTDSKVLLYILFFLKGILSQGMLIILIGCLTAVAYFKYPHKLNLQFKNAALVQLTFLFIAWCLNMFTLPLGINSTISGFFIAAFVISVITNRNGIFFKTLNFKSVKYIGTLSYSLYVWQQLFTCNQPWANSYIPGNSIFLNMILLFIIAIISYHLYEKRFLKLKSRFSKISNNAQTGL